MDDWSVPELDPHYWDHRHAWLVTNTGSIVIGDAGVLHDDLVVDNDIDPDEVVARGEINRTGVARQLVPAGDEYNDEVEAQFAEQHGDKYQETPQEAPGDDLSAIGSEWDYSPSQTTAGAKNGSDDWQPNPGPEYENRTPWMVDMSNPGNPNPRIWMGAKGTFHPLIDAVGLSPGYTVKGAIDHDTDPPTFSHFWGDDNPQGDTAIKHAERYYYQREDKPEDRVESKYTDNVYNVTLSGKNTGTSLCYYGDGMRADNWVRMPPNETYPAGHVRGMCDKHFIMNELGFLDESDVPKKWLKADAETRERRKTLIPPKHLFQEGYGPGTDNWVSKVSADDFNWDNAFLPPDYSGEPYEPDGEYHKFVWHPKHGLHTWQDEGDPELDAWGRERGDPYPDFEPSHSEMEANLGWKKDWEQSNAVHGVVTVRDDHVAVGTHGLKGYNEADVQKDIVDHFQPQHPNKPINWTHGHWSDWNENSPSTRIAGNPWHQPATFPFPEDPRMPYEKDKDEWDEIMKTVPSAANEMHYWDNRQPWALDPESEDVWFGERGEHHDSYPGYDDYFGSNGAMAQHMAMGDIYNGQVNVYDPIDKTYEPHILNQHRLQFPEDYEGTGTQHHADADAWYQPAQTTTFEGVGMDNDALNDNNPSHSHPSDNWVYIDGQVAFGQDHSDVATTLGHTLGLDPTTVSYISNLIARNTVPSDKQVAVGTMNDEYPQVWLSTVDRNAVWDAVMRARDASPPAPQGAAPTRPHSAPPGTPTVPSRTSHAREAGGTRQMPPNMPGTTDMSYALGQRQPYIYYPTEDELYWGNMGGIHNDLYDWSQPHMDKRYPWTDERNNRPMVAGSVFHHPYTGQKVHEVHRSSWPNAYVDRSDPNYDPESEYPNMTPEGADLLSRRIGVPVYSESRMNPEEDDDDIGNADHWDQVLASQPSPPNQIHHDEPSYDFDRDPSGAWEHRTPYVYDVVNNNLHWGHPGQFHYTLSDQMNQYNHEHDLPKTDWAARLQGSLAINPNDPSQVYHSVWDHDRSRVKQYIPTLEEAVGHPVRRDIDPEALYGATPDKPDWEQVLRNERMPGQVRKRDQADVTDPGFWDKQFAKSGNTNSPEFDKFFQDATKGEYAPNVTLQQTFDNPQMTQFEAERQNHAGNFDSHIETSIPGYRELMTRKGVAIHNAFPGASVLDLMGSEGSWGKTLSTLGHPTTTLDANTEMNNLFKSKSQVPGAELESTAFGEPFTDSDGRKWPAHVPSKLYDIVNESMGFQFVSANRAGQIALAKQSLKPNGLMLIDEKMHNDDYERNEQTKDDWKAQFYTPEQLAEKQNIVNVQGEPAEGMMANMAHKDEVERILGGLFTHVTPYWQSGNFFGYAASDDPKAISAFQTAWVSAGEGMTPNGPQNGLQGVLGAHLGATSPQDYAIETWDKLKYQSMPFEQAIETLTSYLVAEFPDTPENALRGYAEGVVKPAYTASVKDKREALTPVKIKEIGHDADTILTSFWERHDDLRKGCLAKYGFDPIDEKMSYWMYGLAEPEHKEIAKAVEANGGTFTLELAQQWTDGELIAAKKEARNTAKSKGGAVSTTPHSLSTKLGMGQRGDLPQLTFEVTSDQDGEGSTLIEAYAFTGFSNSEVGHMFIDSDGLVTQVEVNPRWRRRGVADAMFNHLRDQGHNPEHDWDNQSDAGREWAQKHDPESYAQHVEMMGDHKTSHVMDYLANQRLTHHKRRVMRGFWPRLAADVSALATKTREQLLNREDILKLKNTDEGGPTKMPPPNNAGPYDYSDGGNAIMTDWKRLKIILDGIPDEGFKLMPWAVREYKRGLKPIDPNFIEAYPGQREDRPGITKNNRRHAEDILDQATKWMVWANEHNKPLPDYMNKQFDFAQLEQWVYDMDKQHREENGGGWVDSTVVHTFDDGWHIDKVGPKDLALEGELMGHCVGGYCDTVSNGNSTIFSLRDPKGHPHVTIEVEGDVNPMASGPKAEGDRTIYDDKEFKVVQEQGKSNGNIKPEYKAMVDEWYEHLDKAGYDVGEGFDEEAWYNDPDVDYHPAQTVYPNTLAGAQDYHEAVMDRDPWAHTDEEGEVEHDANGNPSVWMYQTPNHIQGYQNYNAGHNNNEAIEPIIDQAITAANKGVDARHLAQVLYTTAHHLMQVHGREGQALLELLDDRIQLWKAGRKQQDSADPQQALFDQGEQQFVRVDNLLDWVATYEKTALETTLPVHNAPGNDLNHNNLNYPHIPGGHQYPENTFAGRQQWVQDRGNGEGSGYVHGPNWYEQIERLPHFQMPVVGQPLGKPNTESDYYNAEAQNPRPIPAPNPVVTKLLKMAQGETMYHVTETKNVATIMQQGLTPGAEGGFTDAGTWADAFYGGRPVYLAYSPWELAKENQAFNRLDYTILQVNVNGLKLMADLPSLVDTGGQIDGDEIWWEEGPGYIESDEGAVSLHDLVSDPTIVDEAISWTQTAATLDHIDPSRIAVQGKLSTAGHSTDWNFDTVGDRDVYPECPLCGSQLEILFEGGATCPRCRTEYEIGRNDEVIPSDNTVEEMAKTQWPDTMPWGEAGNDYYRNAKQAGRTDLWDEILNETPGLSNTDRMNAYWQNRIPYIYYPEVDKTLFGVQGKHHDSIHPRLPYDGITGEIAEGNVLPYNGYRIADPDAHQQSVQRDMIEAGIDPAITTAQHWAAFNPVVLEGGGQQSFVKGEAVTGAPGSGREGMTGHVEGYNWYDDGTYHVQWYPHDSDIENRRAEDLVSLAKPELKLAMTAISMPYDDNTWYHVTEADRIPDIAKQGLVGSEQGTERKWNLPIEENAVYLWPNAQKALQYQRMQGHWTDPRILRVKGIDKNNLGPDHEHFYDQYMGRYPEQQEAAEWHRDGESSTQSDLVDDIQPYIDAYEKENPGYDQDDLGGAQAYGYERGGHHQHSVNVLRQMPNDLREETAKFLSEEYGYPVMHYGPIHPSKIEHGNFRIMDEDGEYMDDFYKDHPEWSGPGEDDDEDEYYDRERDAIEDWMERQPWIDTDDFEYDDEDHQDDSLTNRMEWNRLDKQDDAEEGWKAARVRTATHIVDHTPSNRVNFEGEMGQDFDMWENRTPYKYDRGNDILHMGTPGHFHRHLEAPILDWYDKHPFSHPVQFLDGAIQGNTHAIWMRPNVTPEHIERLEAAVGIPLTKGHDPDSIAEQADMDMDDGWETSPEEWDKQFAQGSVKTANEDEGMPVLIWRAPEDQSAHDYDPSWDYELAAPPTPDQSRLVATMANALYKSSGQPFEVYAADLGDAVAMYISGTSGYPCILIDINGHKGYEDQFYQSMAHELQHGVQEHEGRDFDEDEAENWHAFSKTASATTVYRGASRVAPWNVLDNPAVLADQFTRGLWTTDKSNANYYATFEQDSEADNEAYNSDRFWMATVIYEAIADQAGFEMNPDRYENDQNNEYLVQAGVDPLAMYVTLVEYDKDDQNFDAWGGEIDKPVEVASQTASFSYVNGAWVKS